MADGGSAPRSTAELVQEARALKDAHAEGLLTAAELDSALTALRANVRANLQARPGAAPVVPGAGSVGGNLSEPLSPQATPAATPPDAAPTSQGVGTSLLGRLVVTPATVTSSVASAVRRLQRPKRIATRAPLNNLGILDMPGFTRSISHNNEWLKTEPPELVFGHLPCGYEGCDSRFERQSSRTTHRRFCRYRTEPGPETCDGETPDVLQLLSGGGMAAARDSEDDLDTDADDDADDGDDVPVASSKRKRDGRAGNRGANKRHSYSYAFKAEALDLLATAEGRGVQPSFQFVPDPRPFNDSRYAIDSNALRLLGWSEQVQFDAGLRRTVDWYREHPDWFAQPASDSTLTT